MKRMRKFLVILGTAALASFAAVPASARDIVEAPGEEREDGKRPNIVCERLGTETEEYAVVQSYDADGTLLWEYTTKSYGRAQCPRVAGLNRDHGHYYMVEDGTVKAFDENTGELLWENKEYQGSATTGGYVFDKDGNLYLSGYLGPDLFVVDKDGKTLYRNASFDSNVMWPYEMEWKDENSQDILRIHYEGTASTGMGEGFDQWVEQNVKELLASHPAQVTPTAEPVS